MNESIARDYLLDQALGVTDEQFEQLCKMLLEESQQTRELELTPFRQDGGIDVHAVIDQEVFYARLGVQAKKHRSQNTVGSPTIQKLKGALQDNNYHIGTVFTTSTFTNPAVESATKDDVRLVDRDRLAELMLVNEVGVLEDSGEYVEDGKFWEAFEGPERSDAVPSIEVPQADDLSVLNTVLFAVANGHERKPEIGSYMESVLESSYASRQADYYGIAAWLLGLLHKKRDVEVNGSEVRRWGLTRSGEEYLHYLRNDQEDAALEMLKTAIRNIEIIERVYGELEREGELLREGVADIILTESTLGSPVTAKRREQSLRQWITQLDDVDVLTDGASRYVYDS